MPRHIIYYQETKWVSLSTASTSTANLKIFTASGLPFVVDWGDGNVLSYVSGTSVNKTYLSPFAGDVRVASLGGLSDIYRLEINSNIDKWNWNLSVLNGLSGLTYLFLAGSSSTWTGSISSLTNLNYLYLNNNISTWTGSISSLTSLTYLRLVGSASTWTGSISALTNLNTLFLANDMSTWTGSISALTNLTYLYLFGSASTWTGSISALTSLTYMYLENNASTWTGSISALTSLTYLYLFGSSSTWTGSISALTNLTYLRLNSNTSTWSGSITPLNNLTYLLLVSSSSTWTYTTKTWTVIPTTLYLRMSASKLTNAEVNQLLIDIDANPALGTGKSINIQGSNAAPTGLGLTAKTNLQVKSYTVLTN